MYNSEWVHHIHDAHHGPIGKKNLIGQNWASFKGLFFGIDPTNNKIVFGYSGLEDIDLEYDVTINHRIFFTETISMLGT